MDLFSEVRLASASKFLFPSAFLWRRLHSLAGFGLVLFLLFHLFTNVQAALWIGDDGKGFIRSVNGIQSIPFLRVVELVLIAMPLVIHAMWGVYYLLTGKSNSYGDTGTTPYLPEYTRNRAYTWQRITSWLLLAGIAGHIMHMYIMERPVERSDGYAVFLTSDSGLKTVASRLHVELENTSSGLYGVAKDFGTAELLMVREAFKNPVIMGLYTLFVLAACFHAFNGLWTFMITWGITLSTRSQRFFLKVATFLMFLTTFFGLAAIYLTYWVNLRH